ncbi:hypothetical protein D3C80_1704640 [compost metagenome]
MEDLADTVLTDQLQEQLRLKDHVGTIKDIPAQQQRVAFFAADMGCAEQLQCDFGGELIWSAGFQQPDLKRVF